MKRSIFCLLIICALLLQSCGVIVINESKIKGTDEITDITSDISEDTDIPKEDSPVSSEDLKKQADAYLEKVAKFSFENEIVKVFTTDDTFLAGDGEETLINSDRIARLKAVEEKFDMTFHTVLTSSQTAYNTVKAEYNSGTAPGHFFALPADVTASLAEGGYLKSLRTSPYFDENAEYLNSAVSAFTVGNDIFAASGDGCFEPDKITALYYNKTDLDSLGLAPVSSHVSDGTWTYDKFYEYLKSAENYEGTLLVDKTGEEFDKQLLFSSFKFSNNVPDKPVRLLTFDGKLNTVCEGISKLLEFTPEKDGDFSSGDVLFMLDSLNIPDSFATMQDVWSIAPLPKASVNDDHMSFISLDAVVLSIPKATSSEVGLGALIMGINAASSGHVIRRYIDRYMNYTLRDNGAVTALNILTKNVNYDFAYSFSSSYSNLNKYTLSAYEQLLGGKLDYDEYVEKYKKESEEYLDRYFPATYY